MDFSSKACEEKSIRFSALICGYRSSCCSPTGSINQRAGCTVRSLPDKTQGKEHFTKGFRSLFEWRVKTFPFIFAWTLLSGLWGQDSKSTLCKEILKLELGLFYDRTGRKKFSHTAPTEKLDKIPGIQCIVWKQLKSWSRKNRTLH